MRPGTHFLPSINARYTVGPAGDTWPTVISWHDHYPFRLGVDIETYGKGADARRIKSVALAIEDHAVVCNPRDPDQADVVRGALALADQLVFHSSAFDVPNLFLAGLLTLDQVAKVHDTVIWGRLAHPEITQPKSLEALSTRYLGFTSEETIKAAFKRLGLSIAEGFRTIDVDSPLYVQGNAVDAICTIRLMDRLRDAAYDRLTTGHPFTDNGVTGDEAWDLVEREQRINRMLLRRSCRGLRVDTDYLDRYRDEQRRDITRAKAVLVTAGLVRSNADPDLDVWLPTPNQLVGYLEEHDLLPADYPRTRKTGRPSTREAHLAQLGGDVVGAYTFVKKTTKIDSDYLAKVHELAINGRIYPVTNLLAATTGRASMGDPPLHQFPGPARGTILADEGDALASIDWSQIEPVTAANVAGDLGVLAGYENGTSDLYTDLAGFAGIARKTAKTVLLAQLYGEGLAKLGADLGTDMSGARAIRDMIFRTMPKTRGLLYRLRDIGERYRVIFTLSGRIIPVPMGTYVDPDGVVHRGVQTHKAVNYFVQGSAYDLLAETLIRVDDAGLADAVYLTMHDELVTSADAAPDIQKIMETPPERLCRLAGRTPVLRTDLAELGERWADA